MRWLIRLLFPRLIPLSEHKRVVHTLREQIARDKKRIHGLMAEREVLLNSSIRQATKHNDTLHLLKKMEEKVAEALPEKKNMQ